MNDLRERQKAEAVTRLKLMGIREDVRRSFEESGTVMLCKGGRFHPAAPELAEEIRSFEAAHTAAVFLAVRMHSVFGTLDALLFVGKYEEDWEAEKASVKAGYAMSYTINRDYPKCSEMGSIAFRITPDGAIVREG